MGHAYSSVVPTIQLLSYCMIQLFPSRGVKVVHAFVWYICAKFLVYIVCKCFLECHMLKSKYKDVLQLLPKDYENTLDIVQDSLTDDQICAVLGSPDYHCANKVILDSLMEKAMERGNNLNIFDQLEELARLSDDQEQLVSIIRELRAGKFKCKILCFIKECI